MKKLQESISEDLELISLDGIETTIEMLLDNEIIEKIPIANIAMSIIKTGEMVYNKNLLKQTIKFIESLKHQKIDKEKLDKYKQKVLKNDKKQKEEIERILLYLNQNIEIEKSRLLSKFFSAYINQEMNWDKFCEFATVLNQIFITDLQTLYEVYKDTKNKEATVIIYESYKISRLISTGLLSNYSGAITVRELSEKGSREIYEKNGFGEMFVRIANGEEILSKEIK